MSRGLLRWRLLKQDYGFEKYNFQGTSTWNKGDAHSNGGSSSDHFVDFVTVEVDVQLADQLPHLVHHVLHMAAELSKLVQELFQLSLNLELHIVLVAEKAEDAKDETDEAAEASDGVEEPDPLLVGSLRGEEVESEELDDEVVDRVLDRPTSCTKPDYMEQEIDA